MLEFDHRHYVPILQWKTGEQNALRAMNLDDKRRMTPLLKILDQRQFRRKGARKPKRTRPKADWLSENVASISSSWGAEFHAFVELAPARHTRIAQLEAPVRVDRFFRYARSRNLRLVPVVSLSSNASKRGAIERVIAEDRRGVCIRLVREDLARQSLEQELTRILDQLRIGTADVDLLVDLHILEAQHNLLLVCAQVPFLKEWRTFTVAAGSFPPGVGKLELGRNSVPRLEWTAWSQQVHGQLPRKPTFGDYGCLHPVPFDPSKHPNPCANIKYTTERDWIVMKGRQLTERKPGPHSGHDQFPLLARLLVEDSSSGAGIVDSSFSQGDEYIQRHAQKARNGTGCGRGNTGNSCTWLFAGLNHHLTFTVVQIAKLFASASRSVHAPSGSGEVLPLRREQIPTRVVAAPSPRQRQDVSRGS
jgi:hypothetical protein